MLQPVPKPPKSVIYRIPSPEELVFAPGYYANYPSFKLSILGHIWSNNRVDALQQALHRPTRIIVTSFNTSGATANKLWNTKH
jgi:hypothetical protein